MARRAPYWSCRCGHRNLREHRKCRGCEKPKPKKRVPKHAEVLRDTPYEEYARLSVQIHGGELDHCAVCKKAPTKTRRFDRDHDHRLGIARGVACSYCNRERLRGIADLEEALWVVAYFERVKKFYEARQAEEKHEEAT